MLSNHVRCGSSAWNINEVMVEKPRKKREQTYIQRNKQINKHTDEVI